MEQKLSERKRWGIVARAKSFAYAFRGIKILVKTTPNFIIQLLLAIFAIFLGSKFHISHSEWLILIISIGSVFVTETINTAIEIDVNLTSPNYHPYARDIKDVSAGAVLISAIVACIIGLIIFLPKIIVLI